ncbi:MAG: hypothetical protein EXR81_00705 [Gammaproteobacteria bacterium]|nr:hypothetical protein [Gammaproteobacteria bacterium]
MMATKPLTEDLQNVLNLIQQAPMGIKISQLLEKLAALTSRRTLQRRLNELQELGYIVAKGHKNSTHYFIKHTVEVLPLSKKAQQLKTAIQRPLAQRKPVGYHPAFLYDYEPNKTAYLSIATREHLKKLGQQFSHELVPGTYVKRILHRLLIDLSWNSSRLEGNTYSLLETERLIEYGASAEGKDAFETQMILNHKDAIEFMVEQIDQADNLPHIVLNIHALLANNLLPNPAARGQLRRIPVSISRTVYQPPEIPAQIAECFAHIVTTAEKISDPFEQAFFFMVQLPYLQPFEDINKRVSRLCANIPLLKHNLSPLSFIDVPQDDYISGLLAVYEMNKIELLRDVFIWAYERSAQHYQLVRDTVGAPDVVHLRFRDQLFTLVNYIISNNVRGKNIIEAIESWTKEKIPTTHQLQFSRLAEKEIASLHPGNIAIYRIKPSLFATWCKKA